MNNIWKSLKPSNLIFYNGGEKPKNNVPLPQKPENPVPMPVNPAEKSDDAKDAAQAMFNNAKEGATELTDTKYEAKPFTPEEMEKKTKGYPEKKPAGPRDLVRDMVQNFKTQNGEDMDHGDTSSAFIENADGDEKEIIILCDKSSGSTNFRMFQEK